MRIAAPLLATGIVLCALATAAPAPDLIAQAQIQTQLGAPWRYQHQSLNGPDALEQLRSSNPRHYRIARRILAAANQLCDARKGAALKMKFEANDVVCTLGPWLTSYPAKRALHFRIDDTVYSALIEDRDTRYRLIPAH